MLEGCCLFRALRRAREELYGLVLKLLVGSSTHTVARINTSKQATETEKHYLLRLSYGRGNAVLAPAHAQDAPAPRHWLVFFFELDASVDISYHFPREARAETGCNVAHKSHERDDYYRRC